MSFFRLIRRKTLRASRRSSYARRERDTERMLFIKRLPCIVRTIPPYLFSVGAHLAATQATRCCGVVEADHAGQRALGRKADDDTCIPLCEQHHRERTDHSGTFKHLTRDELRNWRALAIQNARGEWSRHLAREAS
jgi:hypothetical protein